MFYCQNPDYFTDTLSTLFENVTNVDYKVKNSLPSVRFTGRRRRWRTSLLQFLQVLHEEVCSVVVQNLQHVIATVFAQNLLNFLHVGSLLVLYHLKTLVRDELRLHQQLLVFAPGCLYSITDLRRTKHKQQTLKYHEPDLTQLLNSFSHFLSELLNFVYLGSSMIFFLMSDFR